MTRKSFELWTLGVAFLLMGQQLSLAEIKVKKTSGTGSSQLNKGTRSSSSAADDEAEVELESKRDLLFRSDKRRSGTAILTASDDPLVPDADPAVSSPGTSTFYDEPCAVVECPQFWEHQNGLWADYLFWRARGADVTYATPVNGTLATAVPIGERSAAAFDYDSGFRVGGAWAIDKCSSITTNYTWFRNATDESATVPGGGGAFLLAETVHPNTINVAADSLAAAARYEVNLQSVDLNYKGLWHGEENYALNYLVGVKYAQLEQQFNGTYAILGTTTVDTNVNFNGVGPRFGLEGERRCGCHGFMVYSKGTVNFLVGRSGADFIQQNVFTGLQARTSQHDSRIVTVPELELGGGWQSCSGCFRITAGYYLAGWFNMLTTPEYLSVIRTNQNTFQDQIKTLTLDGLTVRAEVRF